MEYFSDCNTIDEVKTRFRSLSKALHPDMGGNGHDFSLMKEQYDYILVNGVKGELNQTFAQFKNVYENPKTPDESISPLDAQELENIRAKHYFDKLAESDATFDIIDEILEQAKKDKLRHLWVFQEVSKLLELNLDHFKYTTWKTGFSIQVAQQLYKKYLSI